MSDNNKHRKKELEDFLRYSENNMSGISRNSFERDLQKDPFEEEAMEGFSTTEASEIRRDIIDLQNKLIERLAPGKSNRLLFFRIAAFVAFMILLTGSFYFYFLGKTEKLSTEKIVLETPQFKNEIKVSPLPEEKVETEALKPPSHPGEPAERPIQKSVIVIEDNETDIIDPDNSPLDRISELEDKQLKRDEDHIISQKKTAEVADLREDRYETARLSNAAPEKIKSTVASSHEKVQIRGRVISGEDSLPIPGAFISIKGQDQGIDTGINGHFEFDVPKGGGIISVKFIGMETVEVVAMEKEEMKIILHPTDLANKEIVVIEYLSKEEKSIEDAVPAYQADEKSLPAGTGSPSPVSGLKNFRDYIQKNRIFPEGFEFNSAVVVLNFIVSHDGRPENITVIKSPGELFSKEAMRLLKEGPDWNPAKSLGKTTEKNMRIRIVLQRDPP